jgi:protein-export membrane protein SecD
MLKFQPWKTWSVIAVCVFGVIFASFNLMSPASLAVLPGWIPTPRISLGLDLQGGSHLLLEIDMNSVIQEHLNGVVDELRPQLIKSRIGYTELAVNGNQIVVKLRDPSQADAVSGIMRKIDSTLQQGTDSSGALTLQFSDQALLARKRAAIEQSIEIIRRRIDETGTKEPTIESEGEDRILVQLPGIDNPEHVKSLLGRTAKMTFRLVDMDVPAADAQRGALPPGDELLPMDAHVKHPGEAPFYVVKRHVLVDGQNLTDAQATFGNENEAVVSFKFDDIGARRFGDATTANVGKLFAIVLDNKVLSAPVIREPILGGSGQISGNFTVQSAQDLALLLRAGALPAPLTIIEERTVGPDLGADSIRAGTTASFVAIALVGLFMILFYGLFGIYADIALFFNLCLLLSALSVLGATLTLPGIAGIALTMGMAVDANVLVNERIREEVRNGRSVMSAIDNGFSRAYATIVDANVTHLIAGAFVFELGSGPVKGFAVTLCLGILTSLFTTTMVSRLLVVWWLRRMRPKAIPI